MLKGRVFDVKRFAVYDGPGIRVTVFLMGCPLRCAWCHNPEGQRNRVSLYYHEDLCLNCSLCVAGCPVHKIQSRKEGRFLDVPCLEGCVSCFQRCPSGAIEKAGDEYTIDELMKVILKDRDFFTVSGGGVTLSGGEPLVQIDYAEALAKRLCEERIPLVIETCGHIPWSHIERMLPYVERFYIDLKVADPERHKEVTGEDNKLILSNFSLLLQQKVTVIVRIPLIPGYTDTDENIDGIISMLLSVRSPREIRNIPVELLPYNMLAATKYDRVGINVGNIRPYPLSGAERQPLETLRSRKERFLQAGFRKVSILSYE